MIAGHRRIVKLTDFPWAFILGEGNGRWYYRRDFVLRCRRDCHCSRVANYLRVINMSYKIRPIRSTKPGAKPLHYLIEKNGVPVPGEKFLYSQDAERRVKELNGQKKTRFV